ncbi:putative transmembrane protein [Mycolicibacterium aurum]|uniref:Putative transmembrane protein n=1 Tax=Mycolicibacterium aurum TaxID=1791 RepID=A0A3S4SR71_MYCAU|nr:hypothetical protein [Mycolicibacterium aurum]VEG58707.1 putative transmembrane protein [Mycolicibacterium aurum]
MLVPALVCLIAAAVTAALGVWSLTRRPSADFVQQVLRAVAPTQLAAAVMLGAGGVVALSVAPTTALVVLVVSVAGAVGTVAAGCWQSAKAVTRENARQAASSGSCGSGSGSACGTCTLSCGR